MRFVKLGQVLVRRRKLVVALFAIGFVVAGALGAGVADKLSNGGFEDPDADSTKAHELLQEHFHAGEPNVVLVVTANGGDVDDPAVAAVGLAVTERLAATGHMAEVLSYWSLGSPPPLRAGDSTSALVLGRVDGTEDEVHDQVEAIVEEFSYDDGTVTVGVTGRDAVFAEVGTTIEKDLARAELIAFPITAILLFFVFRSVVSALLPLAVGGIAIVGTFLVLTVLADLTLVSIFALNLTTAMGLGLSIDYALFIVSRYREERANGYENDEAVVRTVATAGRAVFFSGLTVAVSLGALLVFPIAFLRSFAYAGIPVVGLAVLGAVVFLPALMAVLGDRIDSWSLPRRNKTVVEGAFWSKLAHGVMARPLPIATAVIVFLLILGSPFLHIAFGLPDDRVLPASSDVRQVSDQLRDDYESNDTGALAVVLPDVDPTNGVAPDEVGAYAVELSRLDGVARVDSASGIFIDGQLVLAEAPNGDRFVAEGEPGTWLSVVPSVEPISDEGEQLVADLRDLPAPGGESIVGGLSAQLTDIKAGIYERLPWAIAVIVVATFVLLFLMFGSVLVPAKALVVNTLSLTATFGAMVWIFQDGHFADSLGFTPTGLLDTTTPVLMFCIAFGMSMDYEVFLLSRIKEEYDRTGDNATSVANGLAKTGRIITAAAVLISVVFLAFATSSVSFIKLFGIGLTLAVLMDATLVRATLVPAFMALAGDANWWAPKPLKRLYERAGLSEAHAEAALHDYESHRGEPATEGDGEDAILTGIGSSGPPSPGPPSSGQPEER